jgi:hypothetical protein
VGVIRQDPERNYRALLGGAAALTTTGIALSAGGWAALGSVVTVAGLLGMVAGLHRFGRLGPDPEARVLRRRRTASRRPAS